MINIHKEYVEAFLLEPTKLRRLVDKIDERLADNEKPEHEVQVDFGRTKTEGSSAGSTIVAVSVRSDVTGWATRTLSEVEEQVERNWQHHGRPLVVLIGILFVALLLLMSQVVRPGAQSYDSGLTGADLDRVEAMLAQRLTLTDEDLREVSTMRLRNVLDDRKQARAFVEKRTRLTLLLTVPIIVIVVCIAILLGTCYPRAVFLWGDDEERYAKLMQRRRTIWSIIVGVTVIGVASRFFFEGVSLWFPR